MKLASNTVLITGGSSGIGFELAKRLIQLGNTVIITGRDQSRLEKAKKQLPQVHTIQSDVSDPEAIIALHDTVVGQFPQLNVLINNAGTMRKINLHDSQIDLLDISIETETNLNGPIRMVKQFLPHLKKQEAAAIMNVTSGLAFVPLPMSPIYCASKAGLHSYTKSLRVQLRNTNVKVFELAPPLTQTTLLDSFDADDMKGSKPMDVVAMVGQAIKGLEQDRYEIRPGQSNTLMMMNRIAPQFILNQLSKSTDKMLSES
ncbi:putative oxidoreductase [Paenibacillus cellulosilyticus]|uniref:Putative oxidoreductase n=1 Tax=Paenibacillus cellulosilyticus TaxID=375489 RepID=A0A2V2YRE3_9BACL|nr:SDR family NAD(P)-dependent oxidoreductase [Paenibacillus cellulosilyticus]PWV99480.1 putative oxidoreductase [Paenibacillus cellulosilyticus]QKS44736.1 SDR family NAD(P)-dependent oxidoreductase [Paenibacillus cellulosilyticus]